MMRRSNLQTTDPLVLCGENDPTERKRILNVLAQRKYRQRKKDRLQRLESQIKHLENSRECPADHQKSNSESADRMTQAIQQMPQTISEFIDPICLQTVSGTHSGSMSEIGTSLPDFSVLVSSVERPHSLSTGALTPLSGANLTVPASPLSYVAGDESMQDLNLFTSPQIPAIMSYTFPDEAHLPVFELSVLSGSMNIAKRLNIEDLVWSFEAVSPFVNPAIPGTSYDHLPVNLQPTATQLSTPHHPMFDLLPWPTARSKFITVFAQPPQLRPPVASTETAIMDLLYDLDDGAEGVKVWGNDPYSDLNWEIGEKVFRKWWWAFDSNILKKSNEWRQQRGAPLLGQGRVLGEML